MKYEKLIHEYTESQRRRQDLPYAVIGLEIMLATALEGHIQQVIEAIKKEVALGTD